MGERGPPCSQTLSFLVRSNNLDVLTRNLLILKSQPNLNIFKPLWGPNKAHLSTGFSKGRQLTVCAAPLSQAGSVSSLPCTEGGFWRGCG